MGMTNNALFIWDFFRGKGFTEEGVSGLLGNLQAESGLQANNLQDTGNKALGMTDEEYTNRVVEGTFSNFINDAYGYGIAQWTYHSRKKALIEFAKVRNKPVDDLETQCEFLWHELETIKEFEVVRDTLQATTDVREASNIVLLEFERPKHQGAEVQEKRYALSMQFYDELKKPKEEGQALKICIDSGHWGLQYNEGTHGYYESARMWDLHLLLKTDLELYGFEVLTTRTEVEEDPALVERGATSKGCDLFLSLHSNACGSPSVDYPVVFTPHDKRQGSAEKGQELATAIAEVMGTSQKGKALTKEHKGGEYYGVLRGADAVKCPLYFLLEHSFHTNEKACVWLMDDKNLKELSSRLALVIANWYGYSMEEPQEVEEITNKPSAWASNSWQWLTELKCTDGLRPRDPLTREEFSVILQNFYNLVLTK